MYLVLLNVIAVEVRSSKQHNICQVQVGGSQMTLFSNFSCFSCEILRLQLVCAYSRASRLKEVTDIDTVTVVVNWA
jgi:hypothetical protein